MQIWILFMFKSTLTACHYLRVRLYNSNQYLAGLMLPYSVSLSSLNLSERKVSIWMLMSTCMCSLLKCNYLKTIDFNRKFWTQLYVKISCFICNAPAKAFIKQIKGHSGYYGCGNCVQKGIWIGKMTFPLVDSALRTDAQFNEMSDE